MVFVEEEKPLLARECMPDLVSSSTKITSILSYWDTVQVDEGKSYRNLGYIPKRKQRRFPTFN
jgi:hypothetical protein